MSPAATDDLIDAIARAPVRVARGTVALARTWRGRFILAWIVVQAALPTLYYVARRDPHDERFAWRMFSPMRMINCEPQFRVDGTEPPIKLEQRFHKAWVELAQRGRFAIVEAMGAKLCHDLPDKRIVLQMKCVAIDQSVEEWGGYDICHVPRL